MVSVLCRGSGPSGFFWSPKPVFPHSCLVADSVMVSGSLCPLSPGPHLESTSGEAAAGGREGALLPQTSCSLRPEAGPEGLPEPQGPGGGPSGIREAPGHPVSPFSLSMGPPPGLQVGLSPLSWFPPSLRRRGCLCPVLRPLPVWPPWSHPGLGVEAPQLARGGTRWSSPDTHWLSCLCWRSVPGSCGSQSVARTSRSEGVLLLPLTELARPPPSSRSTASPAPAGTGGGCPQ